MKKNWKYILLSFLFLKIQFKNGLHFPVLLIWSDVLEDKHWTRKICPALPSAVLRCCRRCLGHPRCLGHMRRGIAATSREEEGKPPPRARRRDAPPLKKHQQIETQKHTTNATTHPHNTNNNTQTQNNTTRPPHNQSPTITAARVAVHTIPHHRPCLPCCLLILVCCLLPSCLCFCLVRLASFLSKRASVCVLMCVCSSVCLSLSVFLSVSHRDIEKFVV